MEKIYRRKAGWFVAMVGAVALSTVLGGCVPIVVGGAAVGATVAAQERSVSDAVEDSIIQTEVGRALFEFNVDVFQKVDIEVVEGKVLLTGLVPDPQNRVDAARLAWQTDGVREVINELEVSDNSTIANAARDSWISTKLRARLITDGDIYSINYTIDTVNGSVYLMGIAQDQAEMDRVINHARDIDYVRSVVSHVRVMAPAQPGGS
ncbi:MAG: BON domain-containing protein [Alphaproteobacteria bacterium]